MDDCIIGPGMPSRQRYCRVTFRGKRELASSKGVERRMIRPDEGSGVERGMSDRFTVEKGNDSEFRIRDNDAERFDDDGNDVGWARVVYVIGRESGQPWHHWIESIADAYCAALNGEVTAP